MSDAENPFAKLGEPPPDSDPQGQIQYMIGVVQAFGSMKEPRMKPLKAKLNTALADLPAGEISAAQQVEVARRLRELQLETFELIMILVNQIRATLRVQLGRGMPKPKRLNTEVMQKDLCEYAQGLRKLISAIKNADEKKRAEAHQVLVRAGTAVAALRHDVIDEPGK